MSEVLEQGKWVLGGFMNVAPGVGSASGLLVKRNNYRTIGDVDTIIFLGWDGLIELLQRPHIVALARRTTLGLMRKGRGMMAKYHDESLADDVFGVAELFEPTQLQAARI